MSASLGSSWPTASLLAGYSGGHAISSPQIGNDAGCTGCPAHTVLGYVVYGPMRLHGSLAKVTVPPSHSVRTAMLLIAATACSSSPRVHLIDAHEIDADQCAGGDSCNPSTQGGCSGGEKCTWVYIAGSTGTCGVIGCAPAGTQLEGSACEYGAETPSGSFDNCQRALVCHAGRCEAVCDPSVPAPCSGSGSCRTYQDLFFSSGSTAPSDGVCE